MKKMYKKPTIYLESFRMSDSISGPCTIDVGFSDTGTDGHNLCSYDDEDLGEVFFVDTINGPCKVMWDDKNNNKGCYHIPVDGNKYFGS